MTKEDYRRVCEQIKRRLGVEPQRGMHSTMNLAYLRELVARIEFQLRDDVAEFLVSTKDLPGEAAVSLTPESVTLVTDDKDNLLAFAIGESPK